MTDEGVFERLATAILRDSDDRFRSLSHPGVNAEGKTIKSPVDGIAFVPGATPAQMIAVHHTICAAKDLEKKWLHDPSTVVPRGKSKRATAPAGDIIKTIEIVVKERNRTPDIQCILILTTNQEPGEALVRDVHATGATAGIAIEIWARSRLAHFLDNEPRGQWLRKQFLGIEQVQLSEELLIELSQKSLSLYSPPDLPEAWVELSIDHELENLSYEQIILVVGESGHGKSVACYRHLMRNATNNGFSLILPHETIESSLSLVQAIENTLSQLHPLLAKGCGGKALQLARPGRRLLISIEDINRSGRSANLVEKISRWQDSRSKKGDAALCQLIFPVWPKVISSLSGDARRRINDYPMVKARFSAQEGAEAVLRRRMLNGSSITMLEATRISESLGNDPLLIALHDPANTPDTAQTIENFIESDLQRIAAVKGEFSAAEYAMALSTLARSMLLNRQLEPNWVDLLGWPALARHTTTLRQIAHQTDIFRVAGPTTAERIAFRHDRVREWLLARAALDLIQADALPDDVAAEPYFAEIFGRALACADAPTIDLSIPMLASHSVLALFCALRYFHEPPTPSQIKIVAALESWLSQNSIDSAEKSHLRWESLKTLAGAEGPYVLPLVAQIDNHSYDAVRARFRNGDPLAGIHLCLNIEPGVNLAGHEDFLKHVETHHGIEISSFLEDTLMNPETNEKMRIGALRLAGHIGKPALANGIRTCWLIHDNRDQYLAEYLWACAKCVDDDPETLLGPVCDAWAALPDTDSDGKYSPRFMLAEDSMRWVFRAGLPAGASRHFIEQASRPELKIPIINMLYELDQPDMVEFIARELAAIDEAQASKSSYFPFGLFLQSRWEHKQQATGRAMSVASRTRLLQIWRDQSEGQYLRRHAFRTWAATQRAGDIDVLRTVSSTDILADDALWQRLRRCDRQAIPDMTEKLSSDRFGYWWQLGRYIWSDELTNALDQTLDQTDIETRNNLILSEMVIRLPTTQAETLIKKHWCRLSQHHYYVIAALYVATPEMQARVSAVVELDPDPKRLFRHLSMHLGYKQRGHPGLSRPEQIEAFLPYLDLIETTDIYHLWAECNERGWYAMRRAHLDSRLPSHLREYVYLDDERVIQALDDFSTKSEPWLDLWLENFIKCGASIEKIMALLGHWLQERRTIEALKIYCNAVLHIGERRHLEILNAVKIEPTKLARSIVANTEFGVKRRILQ